MRIAYFVHDLADAAVHRRIRMLAPSATITILGFRRTAEPVAAIEGVTPVDLGQTYDAKLTRRVGSVLGAAWRIGSWQRQVADADVVIARQLEMLLLADMARGRAAPAAPLVYECLDIHRMMVGQGPANAALRWLERRLLGDCALLVVSSPAFVSNYHHAARFGRGPGSGPPVLLLENKVLTSEITSDFNRADNVGPGTGPHPGPPWRIGWFGVIRCRRSMHLLATLARRLPGQVEIVIRGRVSHNVIPDFDAVVAATPGMCFLGPYDRRTDLPRIYGEVHLNWVMDFYETPGNSEWLLPNRLYEGTLYGAVPLAFASVETGRWLTTHDAGIRLAEPLDDTLASVFSKLCPSTYATARHATARIAVANLVEPVGEESQFVISLRRLPRRDRE